MRLAHPFVAAVVTSWLPAVAWACDTCGKEENSEILLAATIFMSLTPLGLIGGGVLWLWVRARSLAD